jgi:hypothetical protein
MDNCTADLLQHHAVDHLGQRVNFEHRYRNAERQCMTRMCHCYNPEQRALGRFVNDVNVLQNLD